MPQLERRFDTTIDNWWCATRLVCALSNVADVLSRFYNPQLMICHQTCLPLSPTFFYLSESNQKDCMQQSATDELPPDLPPVRSKGCWRLIAKGWCHQTCLDFVNFQQSATEENATRLASRTSTSNNQQLMICHQTCSQKIWLRSDSDWWFATRLASH